MFSIDLLIIFLILQGSANFMLNVLPLLKNPYVLYGCMTPVEFVGCLHDTHVHNQKPSVP